MRDARFTYSANISIMFAEHPLLERPAAAAEAGFTEVELWWPFRQPVAEPSEVAALVSAIEQAGVVLTGLNFWAGDMIGGERGVASRPDRTAELRANAAQLVEIADATGCRLFNLLYGQRDARWSPATQDAAALDAIRSAAALVEPLGGTVLLEPLASGLNGDYPLVDPAQIRALLQSSLAEIPNVRLLFDVFHIGSNGIDIVSSAAEFAPWIGHVQIADSPGRGEPGSGSLPIEKALDTLVAVGYTGRVACEYQPSTPTTAASLGWIRRIG